MEIGATGNFSDVGKAKAAEDKKARHFAPHPNLSLNIGITPVPCWLLPIIAALGALLQLSFFGYATWVTFYYPELYDEDGLPSLWSFCLATTGTAFLVIGMICCAMLVESMSTERRFENSVCSFSSALLVPNFKHTLTPSHIDVKGQDVLAATR